MGDRRTGTGTGHVSYGGYYYSVPRGDRASTDSRGDGVGGIVEAIDNTKPYGQNDNNY